MEFAGKIFRIESESQFNEQAIRIFNHQYRLNPIYHEFANALSTPISRITHYSSFPFLPVSFFKTHDVILNGSKPEITFYSSGTTGTERSRHMLADMAVYRESLFRGFNLFFGDPALYKILALVPSPHENPHSSLGYMADQLMQAAHPGEKNFLLNNYDRLNRILKESGNSSRKHLLIGLTSSLLEFSEHFRTFTPDLILIETGGMKGKRKEMIRKELHEKLCSGYGVSKVHSEYGMTELLSQAWSLGEGIFSCPPWMKILIRDMHDPLTPLQPGQTGGINIIDLANFNSCSFIATQDIGKVFPDGRFEVLGRFDFSDLRGCNLMIT